MADPTKPFHNPFAALGTLRDHLPQGPAAAPPPAPDAAAKTAGHRPLPRAVVRMERSGRGGKAVTVVEHLSLTPVEREAWIKALKASLGCGGQVEDDALVLQGDQRARLPALLSARGVKKVTVA